MDMSEDEASPQNENESAYYRGGFNPSAVNATMDQNKSDPSSLLSGQFEENPINTNEGKAKDKIKFKAYGIHAGAFKEMED